LEDLIDAYFTQFMSNVMLGKMKFWFIGGLAVVSRYQGMGVGRA
jgi:hypothetical protein